MTGRFSRAVKSRPHFGHRLGGRTTLRPSGILYARTLTKLPTAAPNQNAKKPSTMAGSAKSNQAEAKSLTWSSPVRSLVPTGELRGCQLLDAKFSGLQHILASPEELGPTLKCLHALVERHLAAFDGLHHRAEFLECLFIGKVGDWLRGLWLPIRHESILRVSSRGHGDGAPRMEDRLTRTVAEDE